MLYSSNATNQLTKNFNVKEFKCKCGGNHSTILDVGLVEKLQKLVDVLGCESAVITSGFRCVKHDKAVGGNGAGMHTKGLAADVVFNGKDNKAIDTRLVACYAQELGFTGIGRIPLGNYAKTNKPNPSSTAIHLDIRTGSRWYGDETVQGGTANSVTDNYWKYYGIDRSKYFDDPVEIRLQKFLNVSADGIIGKETAAKMKEQDLSDKEYVKLFQELLVKRGYPCGTADGICGAVTYKAMHSAAVDGLVKG